MAVKYRRVLLKISGEALEDKAAGAVFSEKTLQDIVMQVKSLSQAGVQVLIVVGAGNILRGRQGGQHGFPQDEADDIGMVATVINALARFSFASDSVD